MILRTIAPALLAVAACAADGRQLLPNGDFEAGDKSPAGWSGVHTGIDAENRYLHLVAAPGKQVSAAKVVQLGAKPPKALTLGCHVRITDISGGSIRIAVAFADGDGRSLMPQPIIEVPVKPGWTALRKSFFVPAGAVALTVSPVLDRVASGSLDVDDISITAVHPVYVPAEERFAGLVAIDAGGKPPAEIHADGNRLVDAAGKAVVLQGIAVPGGTDTDSAGRMPAPIAAAIELWRANAVRIDIDRTAWTAHATAYRPAIDQAVRAVASRGAYAVLELVGKGSPGAADTAFWTDAAAHFKDEPAVIFALFAQPGMRDAATWRDAMQPLADAVRAGGALQPIIAEGFAGGQDLAGVTGHPLSDQGGRGIAYGCMLHPTRRGWQEHFLATAAKLPIVVLDVGCPLQAEQGGEDPFTWAPDALACLQASGVSWIAGSFAADAPDALIAERMVPTPWWGNFVRAVLSGARFTSDRLR